MAREVVPKQDAHLTYDSGEAENCIGKVSAIYADARVTADEEKSLRNACDLVFSGPGEKGRVCDSNSDCKQAQGLRCVIHYGAGPDTDAGRATGTCESPVTAAAGASCSAAEAQCAVGYHCGISSHCDQDEPLGASCSAEDPCAEGLECSPSGSGESSCMEKPGSGSECSVDSDCASGYCAEGINLCATTYQLSPSEPFCASLHD